MSAIPNLGELFTGDSHYSPPRVNAHGWLVGTGDEIAAVPDTFQVPAALCIENGSGFIKDVVYYSQYNSSMVRTGWLPFSPKHLHDADDDVAGGLLSDIFIANMGRFVFQLLHTPRAAQFTVNKTGTNATIVDTAVAGDEYMKITTGAPAANDLVTGTRSGITPDWGKPLVLQVMSHTPTATNMTGRTGVGMERMEEGTNDLKKIGLEDCSVSTPKRQIITADGNTSSRTLTTTTEDISTSNKSHKLIFASGTNVKYYVDGVLNTTKGNNIPSSGTITRDKLIRIGIKTTNTVEKIYEIRAIGLYYVPLDKWF
jgi:hypothetical protein